MTHPTTGFLTMGSLSRHRLLSYQSGWVRAGGLGLRQAALAIWGRFARDSALIGPPHIGKLHQRRTITVSAATRPLLNPYSILCSVTCPLSALCTVLGDTDLAQPVLCTCTPSLALVNSSPACLAKLKSNEDVHHWSWKLSKSRSWCLFYIPCMFFVHLLNRYRTAAGWSKDATSNTGSRTKVL